MNKASVSGALVAAGWFAFFDAIITQERFHRVPATSSADWLPGFVASLGACAIVSVPLDSLTAALDPNGSGAFVSARNRHCASCSLFFAFSLGFSAVSLAVALLQHNYIDSVPSVVRVTPAYCAWPGYATLVQTLAIFGAAVLLLLRRLEHKQV